MTRHEIAEEIEALHEQAEDLASIARVTPSAERAALLREDAKRLTRKAARLRAQIEED